MYMNCMPDEDWIVSNSMQYTNSKYIYIVFSTTTVYIISADISQVGLLVSLNNSDCTLILLFLEIFVQMNKS